MYLLLEVILFKTLPNTKFDIFLSENLNMSLLRCGILVTLIDSYPLVYIYI